MKTIMAVRRSRHGRRPGLFVPKPSNSVGCQGRSVRAARGAAACLTWEALSVDVRWRASLPAVIVTHFVTRSLGDTRNGGGLVSCA
jgi:hypothetical protein